MKNSTQEHAVVGVFASHARAEDAIKALQTAGIDMKKLSIVGKNFHTEEHAVGYYTSGDRMLFWGGQGAFWGSLWGMLFGGAFFFIPAIGPIVLMGPLVAWFVGALEGAALGGTAGVVVAALTSLGLPKDSVVKYESEIKAGRFMVLGCGSADMIEQARSVLRGTGPVQMDVHCDTRSDFVTRDRVLKLLSDDEIARVSTAETAARLAHGEEYLDLERLDKGVQRVNGSSPTMADVLPKKAVRAETWGAIIDLCSKAQPSQRA